MLHRSLPILRRKVGRLRACVYRIDKSSCSLLEIVPAENIGTDLPSRTSAHPTTSTLTPLPSSPLPQPSRTTLKLPRTPAISLSHHLSTSGQRLYIASLASPSRALKSRRKRGPSTKPRTSKARSYFPVNLVRLRSRIRIGSKGRVPPFLSI